MEIFLNIHNDFYHKMVSFDKKELPKEILNKNPL